MAPSEWTPADLLQLSGGYWSTCALHAAVKLDLFTLLSEKPQTAEELTESGRVKRRGVTMLLNALVALGLLEKKADTFRSTPFAALFLNAASPNYLGYIIMHHHHLMAGWAHLDESVTSGNQLRERMSGGDEPQYRESFLMGMFNLAMLIAPKIVPEIDLAGRRRLLDLGGGPGTYGIQFCLHNPELTAVVYDLPTTRQFAEATIDKFGLSSRIEFNDGNFITTGIEGIFEVAWLSHILHSEGEEGCEVIINKARGALEPGGLILVQEFILDDTLDGPLFPSLFSLNMLLGTPDGRSYSEGELCGMLTRAGFINVGRLPLLLPNGSGVIAGTVPSH